METSRTGTPSNQDKCRIYENLSLIDKELFGSILLIIAYIVIILSALEARKTELEKLHKQEKEKTTGASAKLAATGSWLVLLGGIILGTVAFARLRQKEIDVQKGASVTTATPNIYISVGYVLTIFGSLSRSIGAQLRANESVPQITIL